MATFLRACLLPLLLLAGLLPAADPTASPTQVHAAGGAVRIAGTDLPALPLVLTIASSSTSATVAATAAAATAIDFTAPAMPAGQYSLSIPWSGGTLVTQLTYRNAPVITSAAFTIGSAGSSTRAVTGTDLDLVSIGALTVSSSSTTAAVAVTTRTATSMTLVLPAMPADAYALNLPWSAGLSAGTAVRSALVTVADPPVLDDAGYISGIGGGTELTITGSNLDAVTAVAIGTSSAGFTIESPTSITVTAPAQAAIGFYDLVVTWAGGSATASDAVDYVDMPVVTSSGAGASTQGSPITLTGTNLTSVTQVLVDGVQATITAQSGTSLTCTVPAHAVGSADLALVHGDNSDQLDLGGYLAYVATPILSTTHGAVHTGGGTVAITGSLLNRITGISIPSATAAFTQSPALITLSAGARSAATVAATLPWSVPSSQGAVTGTASVELVYRNTPAIGSSPALYANAAGGTTCSFTGSDLDLITGTTVAGVAVTPATTGSSVAFIAPAHAAGTVPVVLTWAAGSTTGSITSATLTYLTLTGASLTSGLHLDNVPIAGGTTLTFTGTNLNLVTAMTIGTATVAQGSFLSQSSTVITLLAPAQAVGTADVTLAWVQSTVPGTTTAADVVTYYDPTDIPVPPIATPSGGGGCGAGGLALVLLGGGALLLVRRRR